MSAKLTAAKQRALSVEKVARAAEGELARLRRAGAELMSIRDFEGGAS